MSLFQWFRNSQSLISLSHCEMWSCCLGVTVSWTLLAQRFIFVEWRFVVSYWNPVGIAIEKVFFLIFFLGIYFCSKKSIIRRKLNFYFVYTNNILIDQFADVIKFQSFCFLFWTKEKEGTMCTDARLLNDFLFADTLRATSSSVQ